MRKSRRKLRGVNRRDVFRDSDAGRTYQQEADEARIKAEHDTECVLNVIKSPDGDPEDRLEQILEILKQQENILTRSCKDKIQQDTQAAERIREKLLNGLSQLPNEFLDSPVNDESLTNLQISAPANFPSCCRTKNSISRRVIRVLSKDNTAAQTLAEWKKKFNEAYGPSEKVLTGDENAERK